MFSALKREHTGCNVCPTGTMVIGIVAVLGTLASLINVLLSHVLPTGLTFGTSQGSVALIALALHLFLVLKIMAACPCTLPQAKKKK